MSIRVAAVATPLLLAIVPLVTALANNIEAVAPRHAVRPMLATLCVAALVIAVCRAVIRERERGLVVASLLVLLWSAGSIGESVRASAPDFLAGQGATAISALWIALLLAAAVIAVRKPQLPKNLILILFTISLPLVLVPLGTIARHEIGLSRPYLSGVELAKPTGAPILPAPDVYYLVLDGFGREDILADTHQIDTGGFIAGLRRLGFFVADESNANYSQTTLSLASSLNMVYLDEVARRLGGDSRDQKPVSRMLRHNKVREALEGLGYDVYAFETGYRRTEWEDADEFMVLRQWEATAFEALYLEALGLNPVTRFLVSKGVLDEMPGYAAHRNRILYAYEQVASLESGGRPKFVFFHVILPHPPFVFDAQGESVKGFKPFEMRDGNQFNGSPSEYVDGYSQQVDFTARLSLQLATTIIDEAERPVVMLIQADHGPGARLDWNAPERSDTRERMGILNAYYAPLAYPDLYPSISPVNSFRVIFNRYFDYELPLLPDSSHFSSWQAPYDFIEYRER